MVGVVVVGFATRCPAMLLLHSTQRWGCGHGVGEHSISWTDQLVHSMVHSVSRPTGDYVCPPLHPSTVQ